MEGGTERKLMRDNKLRGGQNNDYLRHAAQHTHYVHFGLSVVVFFVFNSARVTKSEGHLTSHARRQEQVLLRMKKSVANILYDTKFSRKKCLET